MNVPTTVKEPAGLAQLLTDDVHWYSEISEALFDNGNIIVNDRSQKNQNWPIPIIGQD